MVLTGMPEPLGATGLWSHQCRAGLLEREEGAAGPDPGAASPSWGGAKGCWDPMHPLSHGWALLPQPPRSPWHGLRGETPKGWAGLRRVMPAWGDAGKGQCQCIPARSQAWGPRAVRDGGQGQAAPATAVLDGVSAGPL